MVEADVQQVVERTWRAESGRVIAGLARVLGDVGAAEDVAQEAMVAALAQWPERGIPANPGAWLMAVGKRRAIDAIRRRQRLERKLADLGRDLDPHAVADELDAAGEDRIEDDLLRLVFTACHPVLSAEARAALTLRMLGGLTTAEIARAFLSTEAAVAQRIVRAKRSLAEAGVPFAVPEPPERPQRLGSVLEVIYLIFNEGYAATAGDDWVRPALCEEALRLARLLAALMPDEPEVHGLLALLRIQASRLPARVDDAGEPILLLDQDRTRWDAELIRGGLAALQTAEALAAEPGPYAVQASIAACHARAPTPQDTDWRRIADAYAVLAGLAPSPVVELNRAVAVGMADGPAAGLALADRLLGAPSLQRYHLLPAVRGDLLTKLGRLDEAQDELRRAAELTANARERAMLLARAEDCGRGAQPQP